MGKLKVTLAYDGTDFVGWQQQSKGRTVQGVVEAAISKMHKKPVSVVASGRTDSGVHAHGQVVTFESDFDHIPLYAYSKALNGLLPADVTVKMVEQVPIDFHPRFDATKRTYHYYLDCLSLANPAYDRYSWRLPRTPQIQLLNRYASKLVGTHDFSALSQPNEEIPNRVRTIYTSCFYPKAGFLVYEISGMSFLWKMVRSIVGTLVYYEQQGLNPEVVSELVSSKDRGLAGPTAPAKGLFLERVEYPQDHQRGKE
jgi:tRNA pseudouridine38-40 synthase